jgi:hypothetical protein
MEELAIGTCLLSLKIFLLFPAWLQSLGVGCAKWKILVTHKLLQKKDTHNY